MHIVAMIAAFQIKDTKGGLLACDTDMLKMKRVMQLEHRRGGGECRRLGAKFDVVEAAMCEACTRFARSKNMPVTKVCNCVANIGHL